MVSWDAVGVCASGKGVLSNELARVELVGEPGRLAVDSSSLFRFPLFVPEGKASESGSTRRNSDPGIHSSNRLSEPS